MIICLEMDIEGRGEGIEVIETIGVGVGVEVIRLIESGSWDHSWNDSHRIISFASSS